MAEKGPVARRGIVGQALGFPSRCGSKGCRVVLLSLLEDQRARAPVKDASEACTVVLFADRLHDPYEVSASLQNIQWLDSKNGSSMMRRTRSLVHAAVRSYSPSSSLRLASVGGPVNACDTFHVHARQTRCQAFLVMRTRVSVVWMSRARAVRRGQWNSNNMERVTGYKHNLRRGQP
jgi:hypothetical protein